MQHTIPIHDIGPMGEEMADAVAACVHCGFCLPTCPTYAAMGEEMDSPRGRILLMKSALEGELTLEDTLPFVDRCLGCMACVSACPSGVRYADLLTPYRARAESRRARSWIERLTRLLVRETLPYPGRFRWAAGAGRLAAPFRKLLPAQLATMLSLLPGSLPPAEPLPELTPAQGRRRARVALLAGCVQQALRPQINAATVRVLARNGVEVLVPKGQGCCGSLMMHSGDLAAARGLARRTMAAFPDGLDAILTNAAGCGSGIQEYGTLFKGERDEGAARSFAQRAKDVSEFLDGLGLESPPPLPPGASIVFAHGRAGLVEDRPPVRIAYHDACHLAHAQRVSAAPRRLLGSIPNVSLAEIPEGELCCGSAGTYNLEQPELAARIGERKARAILSTDPDWVVTGNIGCLVQIDAHLRRLGRPLPLLHTVEVLDRAYAAATGSRPAG